MDLKEYISSGILETYVLGDASPQEKQEVECMSSIYPEIKSALVELQKSVEKVADHNAINPPDELKDKVLNKVYEEIDKDQNERVIEHDFTDDQTTKDVKQERKGVWKMLAAAFFALFLIATTVFINEQRENKVLTSKVEELNTTVNEKTAKLDKQEQNFATRLASNRDLLTFISDSSTKRVALNGTDLSKNASVNVFWNDRNQRVVLKVNSLPETPTDKQYQLWAIVDGKPKDMGVLPKNKTKASFIEITKKTNKAAAFAITLEENGGKPEPNLDQLYVIGNV